MAVPAAQRSNSNQSRPPRRVRAVSPETRRTGTGSGPLEQRPLECVIAAKFDSSCRNAATPEPRKSTIQLRKLPGSRVRGDLSGAGTLPPLPDGLPPNRLALARWLVDRKTAARASDGEHF